MLSPQSYSSSLPQKVSSVGKHLCVLPLLQITNMAYFYKHYIIWYYATFKRKAQPQSIIEFVAIASE